MDSQKQRLREIQDFGEQGGVVPVIDVAATSTFLNPGDMDRAFRGEMEGCYLYSRHSNPTVAAFGKKFAALEGMEAGLGVASGMAAIFCALSQLMPEGGLLASSRVIYGGSYALFQNLLPRQRIQVEWVDPADLSSIERAIQKGAKVVYLETVSNPLLAISDLASIGALCRSRGVKLVVDNTFAPLIVNPVRHGADVVIYSCTKYISGASDLIAGAILGTQEFIDSLIDVNTGAVMLYGPVMDPRVAHELYLRLDHLPLRMEAHSKAAAYFSRRATQAGVSVIYPGLESHPQHALLKKLANPGYGSGGMVTLDCRTLEQGRALARRLQDEKFGLYAVSLGFSRTLMSCPATSTSSEIPEETQRSMGLTPGLLRLSIGYTGDDEAMFERFHRCYREIFGAS